MYSNNILNLQESTTILNAYTKKKSRKLLKAPRTFPKAFNSKSERVWISNSHTVILQSDTLITGTPGFYLILAEFFLIWEKAKHVQLGRMLEFVQKLCSVVFPLVLHGQWLKIGPFLIFYEKYRMTSCTNCFTKDSDTLIFLAIDLIDLLGSLSIIAWISPKIRQFYSYQNDQSEVSELLYLRNHYWTHSTPFEYFVLSSDWHPNTLKSLYSNFRHGCQFEEPAACKYLVKGIASWSCFPYRECPTDFYLLQNREENKQKYIWN